MITLLASLAIMIGLFAVIGSSRGWAREVVATAGIILALFTIKMVGYQALSLVGAAPPPDTPLTAIPQDQLADLQRFQIFALSGFILVLAAFSYQGPTMASAVAGRLRLREGFQERILGFLAGGVNGYLLVGSLMSFNEYVLSQMQGASDWLELPPGYPYVLSPTITRPVNLPVNWLNYLPPQLLDPFLLPLLIIMFLFVIIVLI
jgi:uncharacterized membrane protein required for colicin V production